MSNEIPLENGTENNADESTGLDEKSKQVADQNAIASSHAKRVEKKLTGEILELKNMLATIANQLKPVEAEKPKEDSTPKRIEKFEKELADLRKEKEAAKQEARAEKANTKLTTLLSGKLAEDYADIALEKAAKNINFDSDGIPFFKIGDDEFSLEEGASKWLSLNKRFEKAPSSANKANHKSASVAQQDFYSMPAGDEHEASIRALGALINSNGGVVPLK